MAPESCTVIFSTPGSTLEMSSSGSESNDSDLSLERFFFSFFFFFLPFFESARSRWRRLLSRPQQPRHRLPLPHPHLHQLLLFFFFRFLYHSSLVLESHELSNLALSEGSARETRQVTSARTFFVLIAALNLDQVHSKPSRSFQCWNSPAARAHKNPEKAELVPFPCSQSSV